ncbi:G subunit of V-type ATPase [Spinellus fusiger]|nr:G subunit of V-type ATPase [Spinellus fusiger]
MATSNSQEIKTLLEAEREASKIVQKAKQYRVQRLKDARSEATKEFELLRSQKNEEYQAFVSQHSGQSEEGVTKVNGETDNKIAELRTQYEENKDSAIEKLLKAITTVQVTPHENIRV